MDRKGAADAALFCCEPQQSKPLLQEVPQGDFYRKA